MSLHASEIALVAAAIDTALQGASIREVFSPLQHHRIVLLCRSVGRNDYLQFCLDPAYCRIGRVPGKPVCADAPHPFVMLLRKNLVGKRIQAIQVIEGDRVVRVHLESAAGIEYLVAELTSRHANLFLLSADDRITGSFFPNRSTLRTLVPGAAYTPPFHHPNDDMPNRFQNEANPEAAVEALYSAKEAAAETEALRARLRRRLQKDLKKKEKLQRALKTDIANAEQADRLAGCAEVLKAHLGNVQKGSTEHAAVDFEGHPMIIPLDPKLGPVENMQRMFDKAGRLRRAAKPIAARLEAVSREVDALRLRTTQIEAADGTELNRIRRDMPEPARPPKSGASTAPGPVARLPYREFSIFSGRPARVGRGAKDNDELTLRYAKPDDLWLHVRGAPGSHVVVPMGRKEAPHPDLLIDAAHLAAHFSSMKGQSDVEVLYTRKRYVQKQRGTAAGAVRLLKEKSIQLRVDEARIRRILQSDAAIPDFNRR